MADIIISLSEIRELIGSLDEMQAEALREAVTSLEPEDLARCLLYGFTVREGLR